MDTELYHYGTPRHSGRYPWGSGENPYQSDPFLSHVGELKDSGMNDVEIARALGISTTELRERRSIAKDQLRAARSAQALKLKDKGYSNEKIGELLGGVSEATVRNLLKPGLTERANATRQAADTLKEAVKSKKFIDVGTGTECYLGVSKTKMNTAVRLLEDEGYVVYPLKVDQLGTDHKTTLKVLCPPGTEYMDLVKNRDKISLVSMVQNSATGENKFGLKDPVSIDPKRVDIRYGEDGGKDMDGVILLRRGVEDISLGDARYAQVRIKVGEDRYLKGMAMYSDDLPEGTDLLFNTNKTREDAPNKMDVLKPTKADKDNPFGAVIRQREYIGEDGKKHLSAINVINEEGDWNVWSKTLSSQMLSKQPVTLAKKQLDIDYQQRKKEYDEIMELTNPAVKKKLLESFADECDSAAVHLKAAALPRQASKVIIPFPDIKDNEIYAPGYRDGETVVLIRYPHGGTFEIPTLTVNNKNKTANKYIKNALDAVGINPKVAERLSGADFDGDTVLVIPNNEGKIKTSAPLKKLENFNPSEYYKAYPGMPKVSSSTGFHKPDEMGKVSNLITDMTIKGATPDEIARAVRHSMVVIDAEKHNLNWRQSYEDNQIAQLKEKYQGGKNKGASTLISRASSPINVPQRSQRIFINDPSKSYYDPSKPIGAKLYKETGATYTDKKGKEKARLTKSTKMAEIDDAYKLSSGTPIENTYADYANKMKALGNEARKAYIDTPSQKYSPSAKKTYSREVESLTKQLLVAEKNSPLERQAQLLGNLIVSSKKKANPEMTNEELRKIKGQALNGARARVGAKKTRIKITPNEWKAIQAGAISNNQLVKILNNTDLDLVRSYATPRAVKGLTASQIARARALLDSGNYTQAEVADTFGISTTALYNALN